MGGMSEHDRYQLGKADGRGNDPRAGDGGAHCLRTDDRDYFDQMLTVFEASPLFQATETPAELSALPTDFERDFQARGIGTLRSAFQSKNSN